MVPLLSVSLQVRWLEVGSRGDLNLLRLSETVCMYLQNTFELEKVPVSRNEECFSGSRQCVQDSTVFSIMLLPVPVCQNAQLKSCIRTGKRKGEKKIKTQSPETPEFLHTYHIITLLRLLLPSAVKLLRDKTALKSEKPGKEMKLFTLLFLISSKLLS